jgi:hypothetical protein
MSQYYEVHIFYCKYQIRYQKPLIIFIHRFFYGGVKFVGCNIIEFMKKLLGS